MAETSPLPGEMSITNVLQRLSDPKLLDRNLPLFRQCFTAGKVDISNAALSHTQRFIPWKDFQPTSLQPSTFANLFAAYATKQNSSIAGLPRVIFFGEQHHEPHVLSSQLQALSVLHRTAAEISQSNTSGKHHKVHLVLEHFSILDQPMLASFAAGETDESELLRAYAQESQEGFQLRHYLPLVKLAKELKIPVWGGFPPRTWAKLVNRGSIELAQEKENERMQNVDSSTLHIPRFTAWDSVVNLTRAHKSYLMSLRNPDKPPQLPVSISDAQFQIQEDCEPQMSGFYPAQALKDAYLAHVTAWVLKSQETETNVNIVMVVCGLGHCEYGFGAPERVVKYLQSPDTSSDLRDIRPFIIASKFNESKIWLGTEERLPSSDYGENTVRNQSESSAQVWLRMAWDRKLADAVVLYED